MMEAANNNPRELPKIMYTLPSAHVRFGSFELELTAGELRSTETPDPNNPDPDNKVLLARPVGANRRRRTDRRRVSREAPWTLKNKVIKLADYCTSVGRVK